ncbi:MAG TPA: CvpA family protein [Pirellulaceae bacterium]|nr:CvpA family protein [Pirellulaceae bacterium]HMO92839.1 CvpA family protein [Pirellulaceae bacterium]HMP69419.1 CvpA family protein [Pirellulaceae bacterium]
MSTFDILILVILFGAIFLGFWKGLAWQIASFASLILSYLVASNFWPVLASRITIEPPLNEFIAMFALFLGTSLVVWIVFGFVRKSIERMALKSWDRQAGAIVGAIKGLCISILVTMFAVTLLGDNHRKAIVNSTSGRVITNIINRLAVVVPDNMRTQIASYVIRFNEEVDRHHDPTQQNSPFGDKVKDIIDSALDGLAPTSQQELNRLNPGDQRSQLPMIYEGAVDRNFSTTTSSRSFDGAVKRQTHVQSPDSFVVPPTATEVSRPDTIFNRATENATNQILDSMQKQTREALERFRHDR